MDIQQFIQLRQALGLSQSQLARQVEVSASTISRLESGQLRPTPALLAACFKALQVPATERLGGMPCKPISGLRSHRHWLRRLFPQPSSPLVSPLRVAFALARHFRLGSHLVERLDLQKRSAAEWTAIKFMAGAMNSVEQMFFLHGLVRCAPVQEIDVHEIGFPLSIVRAPSHWGLCFILDSLIYVPQVTVSLRSYTPCLDFLGAAPGKSPIFIDIEIDGPGHAAKRDYDRRRAGSIGLPELRIPAWRVEEEKFWSWFEEQLRALVDRTRAQCA